MDKIELLENKIKKTIEYVDQLKEETLKYQQDLVDAKLEIKVKEQEIHTLKLRYSKYNSEHSKNEEIKRRLNELYRKIEDFEILKL